MKRPSSSPFPNASGKAARRRMEPVAQYSQNNVMPMPYHPIHGASSPEAAVKVFWDNQRAELQNLSGFNLQHSFLLCRVKRVLKAQPEVRCCDFFEAVKKSQTYGFLIDRVPFGPHCTIHQGVPGHAEPEQVLPPAQIILPDLNVPIEMNQVKQENLIAERFNNHKGFDFDLNTIYSEHDSDGSC
ncbi:unnamed protein product [Microthlaspi erraticum]|uniref:Uncharacterized protein n=1 Tax=Microthlaspi erraticum TaxID=1685480 RepID=A0A6D2KU99_9BRAS|nr:unnamed protein product [Microthlaspi erraticum]